MFSILHPESAVARWDALVERLPEAVRDVHVTSGYARVQRKFGAEPMLAVLEIGANFVMQAFARRFVPHQLALSDLASLYGFGGPVSNMGKDAAVELAIYGDKFTRELLMWGAAHGVVAEYCCLHPLLVDHQSELLKRDTLTHSKNVVIIDLKDLPSGQFADYKMARRVRRGIANARKLGAKVTEAVPYDDTIAIFYRLYTESMVAKGATDRWLFPREYFAAHFDQPIGAKIFWCHVNGGINRALLIIGRGGTAYAHFLGTNGLLRSEGLDELLYFETALALRRAGYHRLFLGGGLTGSADDPLLAFKSGFSDLRAPVATYTRIYDQAAYDDLAAKKRAAEIEVLGRESTAKFSPLYRRETI